MSDLAKAVAQSDVANFAEAIKAKIALTGARLNWSDLDRAAILHICCDAYQAGMDSVIEFTKERLRGRNA